LSSSLIGITLNLPPISELFVNNNNSNACQKEKWKENFQDCKKED